MICPHLFFPKPTTLRRSSRNQICSIKGNLKDKQEGMASTGMKKLFTICNKVDHIIEVLYRVPRNK